MSISVGIDLGTTFSAVAVVDPATGIPKIVPNREGGRITPSIVQFADGRTIFGSEAESAFNAGEVGCVATFKRYMGKAEPYAYIDDMEYNAEQLSALLLRHLKEEAEEVLGDTIKDAVITVPAYFYSPEREATINAAKEAGLVVKKIIDEPNAAAMAYGLNNWRENASIMVYDLGGGTFDVTLVRMDKKGELNTITTRGDHHLGGRDWDARIITLLLDKFAEETALETHDDLEIKTVVRGLAEGVKKQFSAMDTVTITAKLPNYGKASVTVTREEFDAATLDLIERTGTLCQAVLNEAGIEKNELTDILLVGGSTRMPQVSKYLANMFGKNPIAHVNPDEAVALGAAIQATKENEAFATLSMIVKDGKKVVDRGHSGLKAITTVSPAKKLGDVGLMKLRETTAHAMGIIAVSPDSTHYINDILIPANHVRPVKVAKAFAFHTKARESNEMEIYVLQGEKESPLDCLIPYKYVVSGIRHIKEQRGKTTIRVQYSYDNNGVIHVEARQENDNVNLPIRKDPVPSDMSSYGEPLDPEKFLKPEPLSVVLAVDVSGSMSGAPLSDAKNAMCRFVQDMDFSFARVGVVAVADSSVVVSQLSSDESSCLRAIRSVNCDMAGISNAAHPFDTIKSMLEYEDGRRFAVVLADGMWGSQSAAIVAAKRCNDVGIETSAIGFGSADSNFLRDISSEDANALMVSQSELTQAFGSIAQSLGGGGAGNINDGAAFETDTWD